MASPNGLFQAFIELTVNDVELEFIATVNIYLKISKQSSQLIRINNNQTTHEKNIAKKHAGAQYTQNNTMRAHRAKQNKKNKKTANPSQHAKSDSSAAPETETKEANNKF